MPYVINSKQFLFLCVHSACIFYQITISFIMPTGTVKFFNEAKGFGFIVDDDSNKDIFVHVTGLGGLTIKEKDQVEYDIVDGKKGLNAVNVKKL